MNKSISAVQIWVRAPKTEMRSICGAQITISEKAKRTAKNEEKRLNLAVFQMRSISDTRYGGDTRNRTGDEGFADLCLTAWLWRRINDTRSSHGRNKEKTGTDEGSEPGFGPRTGSEKAGGSRLGDPPAFLERITGLEPATSTLARSRSTK